VSSIGGQGVHRSLVSTRSRGSETNPRQNPFAPGAGVPTARAVGCDEIINATRIALHRTRAGRLEKGQPLLGLRGFGKTVLLIRIDEMAEDLDYRVVA